MPVEIRELIIKATIVDDEYINSEKSDLENVDIEKIVQQIKEEIINEITEKIIDNIEKQKIR